MAVVAEMSKTRMRWTGSAVCLASSRMRSWPRSSHHLGCQTAVAEGSGKTIARVARWVPGRWLRAAQPALPVRYHRAAGFAGRWRYWLMGCSTAGMGGRHESPKDTDPVMGVIILALLLILAAVILLALAGD